MFDTRLHDYFAPATTAQSQATIDVIVSAARDENRAAARRLTAIAELFEMRRAERGEAADWAVDTWAAVGAEVAAALRVSLGRAGSYMKYGLAMGRLPAVAAVFSSGDIDMPTFQTIVYRTELVTDAVAVTEIDERLATRAARWPSMSRGRLVCEIDRLIQAHDPDAVRRAREYSRDRDVTIWDPQHGVADISGRVFAADAHLLDKRLDDLAHTVCEADPRTLPQRRADALGALAAGADRLICRCDENDCGASTVTKTAVVIHVIAEQATLTGSSDRPGYLMGTDSLVTAEALRDLAASAKQRPLVQPTTADPEPGYRPSRGLSDFVRARDLTCRAPGCDRPAPDCDIDHTVPFPAGDTHASNLKCLCRVHHLLKTFWGWRDRQLPDGTVIWTLPGDGTYVTTPGSALLFPSLMTPTGALPDGLEPPAANESRAAMMPLRRTSRAANRSHRIATERAHNRLQRPPPF